MENKQHDWKRETPQGIQEQNDRRTYWTCNNCNAKFTHYYNRQPDPRAAAEEQGVDLEKCNSSAE